MDERLYGVASYNEIQWVAQDLNAPLEFHYVKRLQSLGGGSRLQRTSYSKNRYR